MSLQKELTCTVEKTVRALVMGDSLLGVKLEVNFKIPLAGECFLAQWAIIPFENAVRIFQMLHKSRFVGAVKRTMCTFMVRCSGV